ncbi:MAG: carbohydrate kinase family protein [Candidatus Nealsonbacteria bacterium]|nr:carbohydrate kinase family protein [Candidatus Nealsonbacteria bacterium]
MFDVITFGSATWDIFLKPKVFKVVKGKKFSTEKGVCFALGSKVDMEEIMFSSGGGGTNSAATFKNQGFNVAFCGMIGDDVSGDEVIEDLEKRGINTDLVLKTKLKPTNHSIVISSSENERTILVYRGASEMAGKDDLPWEQLKAKWFYIAPLSGKLAQIFRDIVDFAKKNNIKVAVNLGNSQISLGVEKLKPILKDIDVIVLNQEEASLLTGIPYNRKDDIFKKIDDICPGIAIMTKGGMGAVISDGKDIYMAPALKVKVKDKTGAGDSFGSGFVSGLIQSNGNIEYAIQLAIANSSLNVSEWGAKTGILKKGEEFKKVKVEKESCCAGEVCACQIK